MSFLTNPSVLSAIGGIANTAFNTFRENTSYSRAVKDMRRAGLNPLNGLSPLGSSGNVDMGLNSALAYRKAQAEIDNLRAQNSNIYAQNKNIEADTTYKQLQAERLESGVVSNVLGTEKAKDVHSLVNYLGEKAYQLGSSAYLYYLRNYARESKNYNKDDDGLYDEFKR